MKKKSICLLSMLSAFSVFSQNQLKVEINSQYNDVEVRANNTVDITSSDLELHGKDGTNVQETFLRFEGINLPEDAVINNAYIVVYGDEAGSTPTIISIKGEVGSSVAYPTSTAATTGASIKARAYTAATTMWTTTTCVVGQEYSSPDIKALLQEMFPSGIKNANVAFRLSGNQQGAFTVRSYSATANRPRLIIDYWSLEGSSSVEVAVSADDARQNNSGTMYLAEAYLRLGGRTDGANHAIRFSKIDIPSDAEITEAYIEFYSYAGSAAAGLNIYGEKGNPAIYTTTNGNITGRTYLENTVQWATPSITADYTKIQSPNLKNLIDENRLNGWQSGDNLAFKFEGQSLNNGISVRSYDGGAAYRPRLVVKYLNNGKGASITPKTAGTFATVVSAAYDDGRQSNTGVMALASAYLQLGGRTDAKHHALRFTDVQIPKDAKIEDAYIEFYSYSTSAAANMNIYAEKGSANIYATTANNITARNYSVNKVSWQTEAFTTDYKKYRTPNLKNLVDENRLSGWQSGDNLAFDFEGLSFNNGASVRSYEGGEYYRPRLVIEYINNGEGASITGAESDPVLMTELYINEISSQGTIIEDNDWIELYNNHNYPLHIKGGIYISDKTGNRTLNELKNIFVPAKGFTVLIADENPDAGNNHLSFDLKNTGESVFLSRKVNGNIIEQDNITFGEIPFDQSFGRSTDGTGNFIDFIKPSHNASNATSNQKLTVSFSHERGLYPSGFNLSISAPAGTTVKYTLDGKYPSETAGTIYTAPLSIGKTTVVKVYAYNASGNSGVIAHTYVLQNNYNNETRLGSEWYYKSNITDSEYAQALAELPIVSISTNAELTPDWVESSVEYLDNHIYTDRKNFYSNAMAEKFGQESVSQLNSGIKFKFNKDARVKKAAYTFFEKYPDDLFPTPGKVQTIEFKEGQDGPARNVFNIGFMRYSEKITMNLMKEMGKYALDTRFVHIYVNGKYRGVKTMRNDFKQQNLEEMFGDDSDNYTKVNLQDGYFTTGTVDAGEGNSAVWTNIRSLATAKNFQSFKEKVDIEDMIKFQIMFMFIDSENEAEMIVHNAAPEYTKAKFNINDTDGAFFGGLTTSSSNTSLNANAFAGGGGNYKYKWVLTGSRNGPGGLFGQFMGSNSNATTGNLEFKTLVKDYVLELIGSASGSFSGSENAPLSVKNVQQKMIDAVAELDRAYKMDAAYMAYNTNVYNQWKTIDHPRILAQVSERVSFTLKKWLEFNMAHTLQDVIINAEETVKENTTITIGNPNSGTQVYYTTDGSDPMGNDGIIAPAATLYSTGFILPLGKYTLTARAFTTNNWGPKTKQNLTVSAASAGKLVITGINYNPKTNSEAEFLLLNNAGNAVLDLSGYNISDAVTYTFPQGVSLGIGETIMLVKKESLITGYSNLTKYQWTSGSLNNSGEPITFKNAAGEIIDNVTYGATDPWSSMANAQGYYLRLIDVILDNALASNWDIALIEEVNEQANLKITTSVEIVELIQKSNIYPNPVSSVLNIDFNGVDDVNVKIYIYSVNGKLALTKILNDLSNQIEVSGLKAGSYIIKIVDEKNKKAISSHQFIKL